MLPILASLSKIKVTPFNIRFAKLGTKFTNNRQLDGWKYINDGCGWKVDDYFFPIFLTQMTSRSHNEGHTNWVDDYFDGPRC